MLVLSRRQGETVRIGNEVKFTVLGINNGQVRIGIDAPREVEVHRSEIWDRIYGNKGDCDNSGNRA